MKITIEINTNEDITEAIQTLQKLLVTEQAPKVTTPKKATVKKETPKETSTELKPSAVFELAKELAKKHGSARVKEVIKKYGEKMADIKSEDLVAFNKDLSSLS